MTDSWSAPKWVKDSIFYQIFPDRFANGDPGNDPPNLAPWGSLPVNDNFFGGDLQGIIDRLSYLEDLGVTAIYLNPIFKGNTNHKYDTGDYFSIDPAFGTLELMRSLVNEAHSRGLRIVLDAVFNHCGEGFWAFKDVRKNGSASEFAGWFNIRSYPLSIDPPSYQTCGGTWYLPKLDTSNPEVRKHLLDVASYWLEEIDVDGWRLDVPWKVPLEFWRAFRERVKQVKSDAYIVGEVWRDAQVWLDGDTCDGVMNYQLRDYILDFCVRDTMDAEDFDYEITRLRMLHGPSAEYQLNLLGSHDTHRILTVCNGDIERVILAMTFLFTYIGAPMVFYGDEVGLVGHNDPDCRRTMPWDERTWDRRLLDTYKKLIWARRKHDVLHSGEIETILVFNGVYAYRRSFGAEEAIVVLNPREKQKDVWICLREGGSSLKIWYDLFTGNDFHEKNGHLNLGDLPAKKALLLFPNRFSEKHT
ncbi:MAG: glycoside hydrolase family 13 protein [Anaerolineae bacterium]|nr:MAG: glycoside hydrolase family 13 protein [Anaerolineae bacterium]